MQYVVWCPEIGSDQEDAEIFEADSEASAAEKWAAWEDNNNSADYWIVGGQTMEVGVREYGTTSVHYFSVSGANIATYSATLLLTEPQESLVISASEGA